MSSGSVRGPCRVRFGLWVCCAIAQTLGCAPEAPAWVIELVDDSDVDLFSQASDLEVSVFSRVQANAVASETVDTTAGAIALSALPLDEYRVEVQLLTPDDERLGYGGSGWEDLTDEGLKTTVSIGESPGFLRASPELPESLVGLTATALPDGTVFLAGGAILDSDCRIESISNKTYVFDVDAATLNAGPEMDAPRAFHSATLLKPDPSDSRQRVLLVGGLSIDSNEIHSVVTSEVYDPVSQGFRGTGAMSESRYGHAAELLVSGGVVVIGGATTQLVSPPVAIDVVGKGQTILATGEVFTPSGNTGAFAEVDNELQEGRLWVTAHRGSGNDIAIFGGQTDDVQSGAVSRVELYKPNDNRFQPDSGEGTLRDGRFAHVSGRLLDSGQIFVAGGVSEDGEILSLAELYEVGKGAVSAGTLVAGRAFGSLARLDQRQFLVTGGQGAEGLALDTAETWGKTSELVDARLREPRQWHASAVLPSGVVLVAGGVDTDGAKCRRVRSLDLFVPP